MKTLKNELKFVKEVWWWGYVLEILDHSDEEVENEASAPNVDKEEDLEEKMLNILYEMMDKDKMDMLTYSGSLDLEDLINWIQAMEKYFVMD